jgi:hypothetical protein
MVSYVKSRSRKRHTKHLIAITSEPEHATVFITYIASKEDVEFVNVLSAENFGIIAILDPKMSGSKDEIATLGVDAIDLVDVVEHLLDYDGEEFPSLIGKIESQKKLMLTKIMHLAKNSVDNIRNKSLGYTPGSFEVDIKNLMQSMVPDVVRLGTEYSGISVPDGYLRYGLTAYTRNRRGRVFGWDAKYSIDSNYRLGSADIKKQTSYINWLNNPSEPAQQFGQLGIYAIISNFSRRDQFDTALSALANLKDLPKNCRIVLIEDLVLAEIASWSLTNWEQVLINNGQIAKTVFSFIRRSSSKPYTVTSSKDWPRLRDRLAKIVD